MLSWAFFQPKNEAERKKKENARIDREIANKKLEIKRLKSKIQYRKKDKFRKKMERLPAQVKLISIEGLSRTADRFEIFYCWILIDSYFSLVMMKVEQLFHVDSFQDIIETSKEIHKSLKSLGCFKKVNMSVDTLPENTQYQVNIVVEEAGSVYANFGAVCSANSNVAAIFRGGVNNVAGEGERLELELGKGRRGYSKVRKIATK